MTVMSALSRMLLQAVFLQRGMGRVLEQSPRATEHRSSNFQKDAIRASFSR